MHMGVTGYNGIERWQRLKYKIGGGGSLSISGPLRDPADISRCIVDVNWAPDLSIVKFLGHGSQIRLTLLDHWLFTHVQQTVLMFIRPKVYVY